MGAPKKDDKITITQSISRLTKIKFNKICNTFDTIAISHGVKCVGTGVVMDKLIQKFGDELTMEDFNPDLFEGNKFKK
jgi:hypothetical protein